MHTAEWDRDLLRDALKEIMARADLTQSRVGQLAGRDRTIANRWLNGKHQPAYDAASRFANAVLSEHPELADVVQRFVAGAGYELVITPTGTDHSPLATLVRLDVAQDDPNERPHKRTLGDVLVERGLRTRDQLGPGDNLVDDPSIDELLANDDFDDHFKDNWLIRYSAMRQEVFERVEREKRKPRDPR